VDVAHRLLPFVEHLPERTLDAVQLIVIHATEEPDIEAARRLAEDSEEMVSAHFYIDRDGSVEEWVPITRVARHVRGSNEASIGIELVNRGRYPNHYAAKSQIPTEPFPEVQIQALEALIGDLHRLCPSITQMRAHSDLDLSVVPASDAAGQLVRRRIDPGPLFPWNRVRDHFLTIV
jgi:N-acetylmuramoyl-L-alanine amidase